MDSQTPDTLRPGAIVGPWQVEGYAGRGTYGVAAYRLVTGVYPPPGTEPEALKEQLRQPQAVCLSDRSD